MVEAQVGQFYLQYRCTHPRSHSLGSKLAICQRKLCCASLQKVNY